MTRNTESAVATGTVVTNAHFGIKH